MIHVSHKSALRHQFGPDLRAIVTGPPDVLSAVHPVHSTLDGVVADNPDVPHDVDRQDDVGALLPQHQAADGCSLTEEQEAGRS